MALTHTLKEQIWILRFLKEIGCGGDIGDQNVMYCDDQGAIAIENNPEYHAGTKHIDIQYHFVRNCVEDRSTRLKYCPTAEMVANGLTKGLGPERQRKLGRALGMSVWKDKKEE